MRPTRLLAIAIATAALVAACSSAQTTALTAAAATPAGQLFCQIQLGGGAAVVAGIIDAAATAAAGPAAPVAVLATNATASYVDGVCRAAATEEGGVAGVPVSPPATPVGNVAVTVPAAAAAPSAS